MKQLIKQISIILTMLLMVGILHAQVPQKFNYQGIARDVKGNPLANQQLALKLTVLPTSDATVAEYEETQLITTNEFGLYTLQIGNGTATIGDMATVKWETGNKYIKVAIDPTGGSNYVDAGTTQLLSVPYAIYADKAGVAKSSETTKEHTTRTGTVSSNAAHVAGDANYVTKFTALNTVGKSLIFDNGSRVGIGTAAPLSSGLLHLFSAIGTQPLILESPQGVHNLIRENGLNRGYFGSYIGSGGAYPSPAGTTDADFDIGTSGSNPTGKLHFATLTTPRVTIDPAGNVGVNTTSPAAIFQVNRATDPLMKLTNTASGATSTDGFDVVLSGVNANINNRENGTLAIGTNNVERMRVDATGNVGIGSTTPTAKLDVNGQIRMQGGVPGAGKIMSSDATGIGSWNTAAALNLVNGNGTLNYIPKFTPNGTTLGNSQVIDNGNFVGIGTAAPVAKLHINATNDSALISVSTISQDSATGNYFSTGSTFGFSPLTYGMVGQVTNGDYGAGIFGRGYGSTPLPFTNRDCGVYGSANFGSGGIGILGSSNNGTAVMGLSQSGYGGFFKSPNGIAVVADSGNVIVNTGSLGIGTATPISKLDVENTGDNRADSASATFFSNGASYEGNAISAISNDGVSGAGTVWSKALIGGGQSTPRGFFENYGVWGHATGNGSGGWGGIFSSGSSMSGSTKYVTLGGDNNRPLATFIGGNVGIGTTNPNADLEVSKDNNPFIRITEAVPAGPDTMGIDFLKPNNAGTGSWTDWRIASIMTGGNLEIQTSGDDLVTKTTRLAISPSGNTRINGSFTLNDGTQGANKVLTSDASGNASWQTKKEIQGIHPISGYASSGPFTSTGGYVFVGPTTTITVTSTGDIIMGTAEAPLATSAGVVGVQFGLGYQLNGTGAITNFVGGNYSFIQIGTERSTRTACASITGLAPGNYTVGVIISNTTTTAINNNDYVNGYFTHIK